MQKVHPGLHVGDESDCSPTGRDWAVVHACKFPCHRDAVGYRKSPRKSNPHYLSKEDGNDLYLNMIDPEQPLFQREMFEDFFSFAKRWLENEDRLLIHCNQGRSRSPSLALLLLATHTDEVPTGSFVEARGVFKGLYPKYQPSRGIQSYLQNNWDDLLDIP
jgi:protein-tyrosine phosphatase